MVGEASPGEAAVTVDNEWTGLDSRPIVPIPGGTLALLGKWGWERPQHRVPLVMLTCSQD